MSAVTDILNTWKRIISMTRLAVTGKVDPDLTANDEEFIKKQIDDWLYANVGEAARRRRAVEIGTIYLNLSSKGREKFFHILARDYDVDRDAVDKAVAQYTAAETDEQRLAAEINLGNKLVPPRRKLLRQFNSLPNGFKFLIDFRAQLLPLRKQDPYLGKLDYDLKRLLTSWFDIGLLDLETISWQSPAALLEKLMEYEAVHQIRSWNDLKNRLDSDRECFAFFHNKMPDEPLIFVEVALVKRISSSIQHILDEEAEVMKPEEADTAIFYSISSTQKGLRGINLGNFLIKRVVRVLSEKLPNLKNYSTLSPVPNFRKWLDPLLKEGDTSILKEKEIKTLTHDDEEKNAAQELLALLDTDWKEDKALTEKLKPILMRLCAHFLLEVKRGDTGKANDPVANFHLSNGSVLERINWLGDTSEKGMKQSAGIMVNYLYKLPDIDKNHETYITEAQISASKDVKRLNKD